ncbi:MAG TPA: hypothetical protein VLC79_06625 [Cellvibrio sp.]|nr:hypothetical protein [Cellvibrio sp.]
MSYDLMVFDPSAAPKERQEFMEWFKKQAEWSENHSYDDPKNTSLALQRWFKEMESVFPPMNGPGSSDDDIDNPKITDHCIGNNVIYSAFSWSCAEEAHKTMRALALKHCVGFFDVSAENGEIYFPSGVAESSRPWWKLW